MLYRIHTRQELDMLDLDLPESVRKELLRCTAFPREGIALIVENAEDIPEVKKTVDYMAHPCEWVNCLDGGYLSALYVINNSFTVTLIVPAHIAPDSILSELGD